MGVLFVNSTFLLCMRSILFHLHWHFVYFRYHNTVHPNVCRVIETVRSMEEDLSDCLHLHTGSFLMFHVVSFSFITHRKASQSIAPRWILPCLVALRRNLSQLVFNDRITKTLNRQTNGLFILDICQSRFSLDVSSSFNRIIHLEGQVCHDALCFLFQSGATCFVTCVRYEPITFHTYV